MKHLRFDDIRIGKLYVFTDLPWQVIRDNNDGLAVGRVSCSDLCVCLGKKRVKRTAWIQLLTPLGLVGWATWIKEWWAEP